MVSYNFFFHILIILSWSLFINVQYLDANTMTLNEEVDDSTSWARKTALLEKKYCSSIILFMWNLTITKRDYSFRDDSISFESMRSSNSNYM